MIKLKRYLKPFIAGLLICIILLFIQAICELNLPNYMSDIVNVGIQQKGIEEIAPRVISNQAYEFIQMFMTEQQKQSISQNYILVSKTDQFDSQRTYTEFYPGLSAENFYAVRKDISQEDIDYIDEIFSCSSWVMMEVMKQLPESSSAEDSYMDITSINFAEIVEALPYISAMLPPDAIDKAHLNSQNIDELLLHEISTAVTAIYYADLGIDINAMQSSYIVGIGIIMLIIALISGCTTISVSFFSSRIAAKVANNIRSDVFKTVEDFSYAEYDKFSAASLITRTTHDVTQIQTFLMIGIRMLCYAPLMAAGGVIMALQKSVSMSWIIATACLLLLGLIMVIFVVVIPKFKTLQKLVDQLNKTARETLNGLMVVRAFGRSGFEQNKFDDVNKDHARTSRFVNRAMAYMMPAMMLIMNGISVVIIWIGAHNVAESTLQVGDMMAFMQYAIQIIMSFLMIAMMFIFIPRASVSGDRIWEVLSTKPSIVDPPNPKKFDDSLRGQIEFRNVSFRYEGAEEDALCNLNFTIEPGKTTAFIGATGSGKSTLVNLIPRFYDVTAGAILVSGTDVREVSQKELRSKIGYIPQKSMLMSGTIESNIKYGKSESGDMTENDLQEVACVSQSSEFIEEKTDKFQEQISQGGSNVSGGQRQRLSIARALAIKPDIFIFDDSFSALDFKTDSKLRSALRGYTKNVTALIVAQRVSTIMNADMIYVIDEGKIIAQGTHKQLIKNSSEYLEIASSQLSKEEIENE